MLIFPKFSADFSASQRQCYSRDSASCSVNNTDCSAYIFTHKRAAFKKSH